MIIKLMCRATISVMWPFITMPGVGTQCVIVICPDHTELRLNTNSSDTEAPLLDLNFSITNDLVSTKIYDKRDDFNFEIVIFPFLD